MQTAESRDTLFDRETIVFAHFLPIRKVKFTKGKLHLPYFYFFALFSSLFYYFLWNPFSFCTRVRKRWWSEQRFPLPPHRRHTAEIHKFLCSFCTKISSFSEIWKIYFLQKNLLALRINSCKPFLILLIFMCFPSFCQFPLFLPRRETRTTECGEKPKKARWRGRIQTRFNAGTMPPHGTRGSSALRETDATPRLSPTGYGGISSTLPKRCDISFGSGRFMNPPAAQFYPRGRTAFARRFVFIPNRSKTCLQGCVKFLRTRATKKRTDTESVRRVAIKSKIFSLLKALSPATREHSRGESLESRKPQNIPFSKVFEGS